MRPKDTAQDGVAHPFLLAFLALAGLAIVAYLAWPTDNGTERVAAGGVQEVVRGTYSPPFIPVTLSVDSDGVLQVTAGSQLITPAGTFSVEWERQNRYHLEVTLGTQTRFYELGANTFKIYLPNSIDGDTSVRYDGEGNVRILVPDPGEVCFPDASL